MPSLLPSLGRRKLPLLEMPKLGGGVSGPALGDVIYSAADPGPKYALCDGSQIPAPQPDKWPYPLQSATFTPLQRLSAGNAINSLATDGDRTIVASAANGAWYYSTDGGQTWTVGASLFPGNATRDAGSLWVSYGSGFFFIWSSSTGGKYKSTDGINFTWVANNAGANRMVYGNGKFVTKAGASIDATSPTLALVTGALPFTPTDVAFGNGIFVGVGASGGVVTSVDGINWTQRAGTGSTYNHILVTFGAGQFIFQGTPQSGSPGMFSTLDGVTYRNITSVVYASSPTQTIGYLVYGCGIWMAYASGQGFVAYNADPGSSAWIAGPTETGNSSAAFGSDNYLFYSWNGGGSLRQVFVNANLLQCPTIASRTLKNGQQVKPYMRIAA